MMMEHLSDDRLIDLARGGGSAEERCHFEGCAVCREGTATWEERLDALRAVAREGIDDGELHRLETVFRHRFESRAPSGWIARLVNDLCPAAAGVRSAGVARVREYEAGPYRLVLRLQPASPAGHGELHGQVTADDGAVAGRVVVSDGSSRAFVSELDEYGEFDLARIPSGVYHASWHLPLGWVTVEGLDLVSEE